MTWIFSLVNFFPSSCNQDYVSVLLLSHSHHSWLPPVSRQDGESTQEFANKVQEVTSAFAVEEPSLDEKIMHFTVDLNVKRCYAKDPLSLNKHQIVFKLAMFD